MDVSELTGDELVLALASIKRDKKDIYAREKAIENEIERRYKQAFEEFKK